MTAENFKKQKNMAYSQIAHARQESSFPCSCVLAQRNACAKTVRRQNPPQTVRIRWLRTRTCYLLDKLWKIRRMLSADLSAGAEMMASQARYLDAQHPLMNYKRARL
jgi:hypothetical protein